MGPGVPLVQAPGGAVPMLDMGAVSHTIKGAVKRMEPRGGRTCRQL